MYLTGDISWEELKAADQDRWADIDWTDYTSYCGYVERAGSSLADFRLINYTSGSSGGSESQGYDMETNTLTYLFHIAVKSGSADFTAQPVTVLLTPPVLRVDGVDTAVTDHPALVTFQPTGSSQTLTASYQQDGVFVQTVLSPFSIHVQLTGNTVYEGLEDLRAATSLVLTDGNALPVQELTRSGLSGSTGSRPDEALPFSLSFSCSFQHLLDVSQVAAVQVGDIQIPLE